VISSIRTIELNVRVEQRIQLGAIAFWSSRGVLHRQQRRRPRAKHSVSILKDLRLKADGLKRLSARDVVGVVGVVV